jgi:hypothetical protein
VIFLEKKKKKKKSVGYEKFSEKMRENEGKLIWVWKVKENLRDSGVDSLALV